MQYYTWGNQDVSGVSGDSYIIDFLSSSIIVFRTGLIDFLRNQSRSRYDIIESMRYEKLQKLESKEFRRLTGVKPETKKIVIKMSVNGSEIRDIARVLEISPDTVFLNSSMHKTMLNLLINVLEFASKLF